MTPITTLNPRELAVGDGLCSVAEIQRVFAQEVVNWKGVKYRHRGMTKNGCDCTGFIIGALRDLGYMAEYKLRMYPMDWNLHSGAGNYIVEELNKVGNEIPKNEAITGDILVFRFAKCLAHVGVYLDTNNGKFIHSLVSSKKCEYAILKNSMWTNRLETAFRLDPVKLRGFNRG